MKLLHLLEERSRIWQDECMKDEKEHSFYLGYLVLFLLSWVLAAISAIFSRYNPVGWLLISLTRPLVSLTGSVPSVAASDPTVRLLIINLFWPMSLVPIQLLTMQGMKWPFWKFLLLWFGFNLALALGVQSVDLGF